MLGKSSNNDCVVPHSFHKASCARPQAVYYAINYFNGSIIIFLRLLELFYARLFSSADHFLSALDEREKRKIRRLQLPMQLNNGLNPSIFEICTRDECSARACDAVSFVSPGET